MKQLLEYKIRKQQTKFNGREIDFFFCPFVFSAFRDSGEDNVFASARLRYARLSAVPAVIWYVVDIEKPSYTHILNSHVSVTSSIPLNVIDLKKVPALIGIVWRGIWDGLVR